MRNIINFLKGVILKLFPSLGYKGTVNLQIKIYKNLRKVDPIQPEAEILNSILSSRKFLTLNEAGSDDYYQDLMKVPDKDLSMVIMGILEWEYLTGPVAYARRGKNNIPAQFVEKIRKEMQVYVDKKVAVVAVMAV